MPFTERLDLIKRAGFQAISIWWEDEQLFLQERKGELPSLVRKEGLFLENIHLPYHSCNDLWSNDQEVRKKAIEEHKSWFYDGARYQVPTIVMHISEGSDPPGSLSIGLDSICNLLELAESLGINIAIENTKFTHYLQPLFSAFDSPSLGLCYDSSHDYLGDEKGSIIRELAPFICNTHLSDNDGIIDRHWIPREGIVDWRETMHLLKEYQYQGILSLEVFTRDKALDPSLFLEKAFAQGRWLAGL